MSNPITLETWVNQNGQTVTVIRGLSALDVPTGIGTIVVPFSTDMVLVIYPKGDGKFVLFASLASEGYTLQPEEPSPPPPPLTALGVDGGTPPINWRDIN